MLTPTGKVVLWLLGVTAAIVLGSLLLGGCANMSAYMFQETTADILEQVGKQFVETDKFYKEARTAGAITDAEYQQWAAFIPVFQKAWDRAHDVWKAGGDMRTLREQLDSLRRELLIYALKSGRSS